MAENKTEAIKRLYKDLQGKFSPTNPVDRPVLEHLIFGTCLEDASYEAAESAFAAIQHTMSGWNEVRVSSVAELAELMAKLPDPRGCAARIKKILYSIFEERYEFTLEDLLKRNLKEAFEKLESLDGATPFAVTYTAQVAFGRHGIPVGRGEKQVLSILGLIGQNEMDSPELTSLNRAIAKPQGVEFASLLHKLAAAFVVNPESRKVIAFLRAFAPDFRERMPKRREKPEELPVEEAAKPAAKQPEAVQNEQAPVEVKPVEVVQPVEEAAVKAPEKKATPVVEKAPQKPVEKPVAKPAAKPEVKAVSKQPVKPVAKPAAKSAVAPAKKVTVKVPEKTPAKPAAKETVKSTVKVAASKGASAAVAKKPVVSSKPAASKATVSAKPVAKAAVKPAVKGTTAAKTKVSAKAVAKNTVKVVAKPAPKATAKPAAKSTVKTVVKAATKPVSKPAAKSAVKPVSKPVAKLGARPAVKAKPVSKSVSQSAAKASLKAAMKPVTKPVKSAAKPVVKSTAKPAKPVAKAVAKPTTKVTAKAAASSAKSRPVVKKTRK